MSITERSVPLTLVLAAALAWLAVAILFATLSPVGDAGVQLLGALALGAAVALTVWPMFWAVTRPGPEATLGGRLVVSGRRSGLVGLVVSILVILRALDAVSFPVLAFLIAGAVLVEAAVSLRR